MNILRIDRFNDRSRFHILSISALYYTNFRILIHDVKRYENRNWAFYFISNEYTGIFNESETLLTGLNLTENKRGTEDFY